MLPFSLPDDESMPGHQVGRFQLEARFDVPFVARLALREKQVQQSYRPIISIHKWFARRPGSVFRSLLLSELGDGRLEDSYWRPNDIRGVIADPFMGGGTTIFESLRIGLGVVGRDINPMAYWLVRQAVEPLDIEEFSRIGQEVWENLKKQVGHLYKTRCLECDNLAEVKYFIWVKTCSCPSCGEEVPLFPGYRVAESVRHPREVFHCPECEELCELEKGDSRKCAKCERSLQQGNTSRGKTTCLKCETNFTFSGQLQTPPQHKLFAIEYRCGACYKRGAGRQFKSPDTEDRTRVMEAEALLLHHGGELDLPEDTIPEGDETNRLHRWGYHSYRDMFSSRQLFGLGCLMNLIKRVPDSRIRQALATVFSDFLRYQNLLCRYDTYALKCQDIFSVHGFPVGLVVCENNLPGIAGVGSGSFIHFIEKFAKAKQYAQSPHETQYLNKRKTLILTPGESIEASLVMEEPDPKHRSAWLDCEPSQDVDLRPQSLDAVFTDPPYYDNVQYAELMDFCFVWLRKILAGDDVRAFRRESTRSASELTGNATLKRGLGEFTEGLSKVFTRMAFGMKESAPLAFTYHHNDPLAYAPLAVAILDAGLTCTAVLPAPAEMAASLHIAGTKSSVLDSIFVCRKREYVWRYSDEIPVRPDTIDALVEQDVSAMAHAGYKCTTGDVLCLRAGHIAAKVIQRLADGWNKEEPLANRLDRVSALMSSISSEAKKLKVEY
jgi:adenine-specific DNA methylase